MKSIQRMIEAIVNDSQAAVLAMIVHIEGSAYRKEGAWLLMQEDDSQFGTVSGGCLESDLHARAQTLFNTGKTEVYAYDLSAEDDLGWGRGAGCNGVVSIMMRDIDALFREKLAAVHRDLQAKDSVLFIQSMKDYEKYTMTSKCTDEFGFWDGDSAWEWNDATKFQHFAGQKLIQQEMYYIQLLWPKPSLYIIGAGTDARPLARLAHTVGYDVHILDWRALNCTKEHFPTATSLHTGDITQLLQKTSFDPVDAAVIMTHDFQADQKILQALKDVDLFYVGLLGSKERTSRLFDGQIPKWLHSPVGLSIGADGPEEIAVSIVAELIAKKGGK